MSASSSSVDVHDTAEFAEDIGAAFREFVGDVRFPCLAGKGVVRRRDHTVRVYGALGSPRGTSALASDLAAFARSTATSTGTLRAFVAVFPDEMALDERDFERRLWVQLQRLHEHDAPGAWDPGVSDDPADARFSFSFAGEALFVVGLHPRSSRLSRRFRWPTLVFNPRAQFERLRAEGKFERVRAMVRERDLALQGSLNPNLADFGERSEARQYSGRAVEADWKCPFHRKTP